jgi:hypothetical protein
VVEAGRAMLRSMLGGLGGTGSQYFLVLDEWLEDER